MKEAKWKEMKHGPSRLVFEANAKNHEPIVFEDVETRETFSVLIEKHHPVEEERVLRYYFEGLIVKAHKSVDPVKGYYTVDSKRGFYIVTEGDIEIPEEVRNGIGFQPDMKV